MYLMHETGQVLREREREEGGREGGRQLVLFKVVLLQNENTIPRPPEVRER